MLRFGFLIALMSVAGAVLLYSLRPSGPDVPPLDRFPIQGIDVSHHQKAIDWNAVSRDPRVRFVYMKATEGGDHRDTRFRENWDGAAQAGLVRGAYHYFTFCRPGKEQAQNVMEVVPAEAGTLPLAVDLEFHGNCTDAIPAAKLGAELAGFLAEVKGFYGRDPILYGEQDFFDRFTAEDPNTFPPLRIWLRSIGVEPRQERCARWTIWQHADTGNVQGVTGPVDLNAFCGGAEDFRAFVNSSLDDGAGR
ncbi:GH25 family lysozyme [Terrihabitans sp. B22-R8]|uniref:GH25 family lysozyme n=1 Tax=Terrihabitans sp. B22-R8 TaxID=3425128 RepID=UPI00403C6FFD